MVKKKKSNSINKSLKKKSCISTLRLFYGIKLGYKNKKNEKKEERIN